MSERRLFSLPEKSEIKEIEKIRQAVIQARRLLHPYSNAAEFVHSHPFGHYADKDFIAAAQEIKADFGQEGLPTMEDLLGWFNSSDIEKEDLKAVIQRRYPNITDTDSFIESIIKPKQNQKKSESRFQEEEDTLTSFIDGLIIEGGKTIGTFWRQKAVEDLEEIFNNFGKRYTASQFFYLLSGKWDIVDALNWQMDELLGRFFDRGIMALPQFDRKNGLLAYWKEKQTYRIPIFRFGINGEFIKIDDYQRKFLEIKDLSAEEIIIRSLKKLGIKEEDYQDYFKRMMVEQPGWFSAVIGAEERKDWYPIKLEEVLAIRLFYEAEFFQSEVKKYGWGTEVNKETLKNYFFENIGEWFVRRNNENIAFSRPSGQRLKLNRLHGHESFPPDLVSYIIPYQGWINRLEKKERYELLAGLQYSYLTHPIIAEEREQEGEDLSEFEKRVILFKALENNYQRKLIERLRNQPEKKGKKVEGGKIRVLHCMDERTVYLSEKLKEILDVKTFGVPGSFFVPMDEIQIITEYDNNRKKQLRQIIELFKVHGLIDRLSEFPILLNAFGSIQLLKTTGELVLQSLAPEERQKIIDLFENLTQGETNIKMTLSFEEKGEIVKRVLDLIDIDYSKLGKDGKELFVIQGHGSTSKNNPLEAAHNCGACGKGRDGWYNAQLFALFANDSEVRKYLFEKYRIDLTNVAFMSTYFDTAKNITRVPHQSIPNDFKSLVEQYMIAMDETDKNVALFRCQSLPGAPRTIDPEKAQRHTLKRSLDWAESFPENGHAGAAVIYIGKGETGFADGRAFKIAYDYTKDKDGEKLKRRIIEMGKIAEGIIFEYYYSRIDPHGPLSGGNKVTSNVVGEAFIRSGINTDIKVGLPWQMVAKHIPLRPHYVIEAPVLKINQLLIDEKVFTTFKNSWNILIVKDPETNIIYKFNPENGNFEEMS
jgi:hypothetical protein